MRKQDRVAAARQQQGDQEALKKDEPREQEKVKGSASADQPARPPRQGGRLPLPD